MNPRYRQEYQELGCWFLYQFARPIGAPDWDDLTPHQQALVQTAFRIGVASLDADWFRPTQAEDIGQVTAECARNVVWAGLEQMRRGVQ